MLSTDTDTSNSTFDTLSMISVPNTVHKYLNEMRNPFCLLRGNQEIRFWIDVRKACFKNIFHWWKYVTGEGCGQNQAETRIADGFDGNTWPWIASIGSYDSDGRWRHFCGGTLIDHNNVLTAAHCVQPVKDNNLK